jgi:Ca-activated chloride channel family protein
MQTPILFLVTALLALTLATPSSPVLPTPDRLAVPVTTGDRVSLVLTGQVVDTISGRPLEDVVVTVDGVEGGALTGRLGRYLIRVPAERASDAEWTVRATFVGYAQSVRVVRPSVHVDGVLTVDFHLAPRAVQLEGVVVTGTAIAAQRRSVGAPRASNTAEADAAQAHMVERHRFAPSGGPPHATGGEFEREQYARIVDNDFRTAVDAPLSTFSIDVDRASYSNVRRFLMQENRLPPVDAVQIEEMVNYFPYRYDLPRGDEPVAVTTELGDAPWMDGHRILRVGVATRPVATEDLPPANLVFLIDVSGSMQSEDKLALVKRSLRLLVDELRPQDRVSMVVYAGAAGVVLEPTSGGEKTTILSALDRLEAGGSTAGGLGLRLAYDVARRNYVDGGNNRVILATDGDFNVGESSDAAMTRLVETRREEGTFLTILGFGTGNLQSTKMQEMAQNGNGNYAYIDGLREARKVLVGEMGGTILTVAKDVKVQVEFNPAQVRAYRLLGYENRLLAAEDFNDDTKDAGEIGAGHTVTALYEIVPVGSRSDEFGRRVDSLRYRTPDPIVRAEPSGELAFVKVRYKDPDGDHSRLLTEPVSATPVERPSEDLRFASAVAGFGMLLRESEHRGSVHAAQILDLAGSAIGRDADGYRREFLDLVQAYQLIAEGTWTDSDGR